MKVKHVLMIEAVLLAMLVMPVAGTDSTLTYDAGDITYTVVIPPAIDFTDGATISVSDVMLEHSTCLNITVASIGNWHLKPENGANAEYEYEMLVDGAGLSSDNLVISIPDSLTGKSAVLTFENIDQIDRAGKFTDTLTFTIRITAGEGVTTQYVDSTEGAQAAIDNAVPGTTIRLQPGVDYGTLVFRQNARSSTVVDITDAGGDAAGNEHYSRYEDITIIGAEGAIVDQIDFKVGWIDGHEGASYVDIKNLKVQGVTFSGEKTAFNLEGSKGGALGIDGLTIEDCKMTDDGDDRFVFQQISGYKILNDKTNSVYVMTTGVKNLKITGCEVTGAYMVIESRAMEDLTITNNVFSGIKERDMLITSDITNHPDKTYTGTITITGNTADSSEERFIRASLNLCDANVVITGNSITNYKGAEDDYIKVEGVGAGTLTISGNTATPADSSRTLTTYPVQQVII